MTHRKEYVAHDSSSYPGAVALCAGAAHRHRVERRHLRGLQLTTIESQHSGWPDPNPQLVLTRPDDIGLLETVLAARPCGQDGLADVHALNLMRPASALHRTGRYDPVRSRYARAASIRAIASMMRSSSG